MKRNTFAMPSLLIALSVALVAGVSDASSHGRAAASRASAAPLRDWMVANATPAVAHADNDKIAQVFQRISAFAPGAPGFERWSAISQDGAAAAKRGDKDGARRACRACHEAMRAEYKKRFRDKPLPR